MSERERKREREKERERKRERESERERKRERERERENVILRTGRETRPPHIVINDVVLTWVFLLH